ncbi:MAG: sugar ABC transporter permease [Sphaerochaetaceae bacterium]|nr:sugar ABC transporter permease [Sphaerochaetaceae bacterium]
MKTYGKDVRTAYLLVAPVVFLSIVFFFFPVIYSFILGFYDWNLLNVPLFIGFKNFSNLFASGYFRETLFNTLIYSVGLLLLLMVFGLLFALILNKPGKFSQTLQSCIFSSYLVSWVTIGLLWVWMLDPQYGLVNTILNVFGIHGKDWLGDVDTALITIIIVSAWKMVGYPMIIFLSGLRTIPDDLYQAASIDGANQVQKFVHITWPLLSPTTLFLFITMLITSFQGFDIVKLMTQGGPVHATTIYVYYIYEQAFMHSMRLGYASAAVTIFFIIILALTLFQYKVMSKRVHYQ